MQNDVWIKLLFFLLCITGAIYLSHVTRAAEAPAAPVMRAYVIDWNWLQVKVDVPPGKALPEDSLNFSVATPGVTLDRPKLPAADGGRYTGQMTINLPVHYADGRPQATMGVDLKAQYSLCSGSDCTPAAAQDFPLTVPAPQALDTAKSDRGGIAGLLAGIRASLGMAPPQQTFLKPDQVFSISVQPADGRTLIAHWRITDGYYLYKKKFHFDVKQGDVTLGALQLPSGTFKYDQTFGMMEVYHHGVSARIPVTRNGDGPERLVLVAHYQGCADAGFCYPPITKTVSLDLPPPGVAVPGAISPAPAADLSETDRIARSLARDNLLIVLPSFFGLGLLLAFTPCVLPMVPILSGIIVGRGEGMSTHRAFVLSLAYVLPMAATYTAAGVVAALAGENLQAVFQAPWIIALFSGVFVLLALSMFGLYELQLPSRWQTRLMDLSNRQRSGSLLGVGAMGLLSALIVGPCVAAPLAGTLLYIGQSHDAVVGGAALFAMALGMGAPLVVFGTSAGKLLPKVGPWMASIKTVFGVLLLGVAIWFLDRILPPPVTLALWAGLLILAAVLLGAATRLQPGASLLLKLRKGAGLACMVYGVIALVGAATGGADVFQPLKGLALAGVGHTGVARPLQFVPIKGLDGLQRQLAAANREGRPVMLDFYADWCVDCKRMERTTFSNPGVQAALSNFIVLQADITPYDDQDKALLNHYGLPGPPALLFFGPDGKELRSDRLIGYIDADGFIGRLPDTRDASL